MEFRIADTFTESLARLTGEEQKAVKTTAFDLQMDPANPGMSFHKLDKAKDKNFWSVRVSRDLRLIVHKTAESLLLCYVDHHDRAYAWAENRKLETHPKTGAAQWVEIRETVQEILIPAFVETPQAAPTKPPLFAHLSEDELLSFGVPVEWLPDARVLLTTFSGTLANALRAKLTRLIGTEPRLGERIEVDALDTVARRLYQRTLGRAQIASPEVIRDLMRDAAGQSPDQKFSLSFLVSEWAEVVDAWQLASWETYRDLARLAQKTRLPEKQSRALLAAFEH